MYTSVLSLALLAAAALLTAATAEDITAVCVLAGDAGVSGRAFQSFPWLLDPRYNWKLYLEGILSRFCH